jgi:hypothetical protein
LKDTKFFCDPCKTKPFTKDEKLGFEIIYNLHQGEGHEVVEYRKPEPLYRCVTCNDAGPFSESDVGSDGKSIVGLHRKLGHEVTEYHEKEHIPSFRDGVVEDKRVTIRFEDYKSLQDVENEIKAENDEYVKKPNPEKSIEHIVEFGKKIFTDPVIADNDSTRIFGYVQRDEQLRAVQLDSEDAQDILITMYSEEYGKYILHSQAESALRIIKGKIRIDKTTPKRQLYIRIAFVNETLYYDLANQNNDIVKITKDKLEIIPFDKSCPLFIRHSSMSEQVKPNFNYQGNPLEAFFKFLRKDNDIVFKCNILSLFLEHILVPIPLIGGTKGTSKTTTSASIKMLVDPAGSRIEDYGTSLPEKEEDFATHMYCNYMFIFENVSDITSKQSDWISKACTGSNFSTRKHYKQGVEIKLSFRRKGIINGIIIPLDTDDFSRRVLSYDFRDFVKGEKKTDADVKKMLDELMPDILAQAFVTLQKAMSLYDDVKSRTEVGFRGDFALWGETLSLVLGSEPKKFLEALEKKEIQNQSKLAQNNYLIPYIEELFGKVDDLQQYCTSVTDFFKGFKIFCNDSGFDLKIKESFPTSSGKLPDIVKRSSTLLNANHYKIDFRNSTIKETHNNKTYGTNIKFIEIKKIKEVLFA